MTHFLSRFFALWTTPQKKESGSKHWVLQRVSAVGTIVFAFWSLALLFQITPFTYDSLHLAFDKPSHVIAMGGFLFFAYYHAWLGIEMVIEDYIHHPLLKTIFMATARLACFIGAFVGLYSLLIIILRN